MSVVDVLTSFGGCHPTFVVPRNPGIMDDRPVACPIMMSLLFVLAANNWINAHP